MSPSTSELNGADDSMTAMLGKLAAGDRAIEGVLLPQIYDELRRQARLQMRRERANHTLQPTALVHEAYARLVKQTPAHWQHRAHFFAAAAQLMRHILVDHARARQAGKRGGLQRQITLGDAVHWEDARTVDVLAVHEALEHLALLDARQAKIVELHFFAGLNFEEIAAALNLGERTVKRDWSMARAWLKGELAAQPNPQPLSQPKPQPRQHP